MPNYVSSLIFGIRNTDKVVEKGDIGRIAVVPAQFLQAAQRSSGNFAKNIIETVEIVSKTDTILGKMAKGVNWATHYVNPLLCCAAGIRVLKADKEEKGNTFRRECAAMTSMFAGEHFAKKILNSNVIKHFSGSNTIDTLTKIKAIQNTKFASYLNNMKSSNLIKWVDSISKGKYSGKIGTILRGTAFVCASVAAYSTGTKVGDYVNKISKNEDNIVNNFALTTNRNSSQPNYNDNLIKSSLKSSTKTHLPANRLMQIA